MLFQRKVLFYLDVFSKIIAEVMWTQKVQRHLQWCYLLRKSLLELELDELTYSHYYHLQICNSVVTNNMRMLCLSILSKTLD